MLIRKSNQGLSDVSSQVLRLLLALLCAYRVHCADLSESFIEKVFFSYLICNNLRIGNCNSPLGMESGDIADFQITASSAHDIGNVGPQHARYKQK